MFVSCKCMIYLQNKIKLHILTLLILTLNQRSCIGQDVTITGFWLYAQKFCPLLVGVITVSILPASHWQNGFIMKIFWISLLNPIGKSNYFQIELK